MKLEKHTGCKGIGIHAQDQIRFGVQISDTIGYQLVISYMYKDVFNVRNWCFRNRLLLNPTKTKLMVLGSSQLLPPLQDFSVSLLLKDIFPTQTAKDLGVTLDPYLFFDEHIINMFLLVCLTVGKKKKMRKTRI